MLFALVENIPGICQLKPELEECLVHILNGRDVVALLPTSFGKSLIYQLLPIVCEKLGRPKSGKAILVIVSPLVALMDDQVKEPAKLGLCAAQLGVHNDREIMEGNFSLVFWYPNPGFSIQNGELCWHQSYTNTTSSPLLSTRHTSHTNGKFAYTGLVINFNKLIYFNISSVRLSRRITYAITKHYVIGLRVTPMILNFRQAPAHEKVNAFQLCPSRLGLRSKAK